MTRITRYFSGISLACADDNKSPQAKTQHKQVHLISLNIPSHTSLVKRIGPKQMFPTQIHNTITRTYVKI